MTRDRAGSDAAILDLLEAQTPNLQRLPPAFAYVRPAVAAFKYGANDELAERWAGQARAAGTGHLLRSSWGLRLLFWHSLPRSGRRAMRSAQSHTRNAVKSANLRLRGGPSVT